MPFCKHCNKFILNKKGKKPKEFCNNNCRSNFWYSKNKAKTIVVQDLTKPTNEIKPMEQPKTNYSAVVLPIKKSRKEREQDQMAAYINEIESAKTSEEISLITKSLIADGGIPHGIKTILLETCEEMKINYFI